MFCGIFGTGFKSLPFSQAEEGRAGSSDRGAPCDRTWGLTVCRTVPAGLPFRIKTRDRIWPSRDSSSLREIQLLESCIESGAVPGASVCGLCEEHC